MDEGNQSGEMVKEKMKKNGKDVKLMRKTKRQRDKERRSEGKEGQGRMKDRKERREKVMEEGRVTLWHDGETSITGSHG